MSRLPSPRAERGAGDVQHDVAIERRCWSSIWLSEMTVIAWGMSLMSVSVLVAVLVERTPYSTRWPVTTIDVAGVGQLGPVDRGSACGEGGRDAPASSAAASETDADPCHGIGHYR